MTRSISVRLDSEISERLKILSELTGRSKSYYIKEAIEQRLDEMELIYLAQSRSENLRSGKSHTVSWEELKKRNGLED